ncbi:MAG: alpha-glucosidase/alpha-galactosidase, partial [Ruminococcaceae bacterium]|nr:alpha-glucosidase/alpha-galactosidase [Oscillospiraceae bacterium]
MKITFMGAGSTVFSKNVLGDTMLCTPFHDVEIALYDIDPVRLDESYLVIDAMNKTINEGRATIKKYLGIPQRKDALRGADFVVNAIQVGLYDPCTIIDFEIPKKYGLRQTIGDTLGIGGIMRGLRTIHVMKGFAEDIEEVCPNAWFLNYTNPMAILSGYMQRYTKVKTVGLCHSVQVCAPTLLNILGFDIDPSTVQTKIAGINHMAWLLEIFDKDGNDLYPEIKRRAKEKNANEKHWDMVRFDYIEKLGYYCTESSEHNAEYNPFYIKAGRDDLIEKFNIPLDEYPRRCINQIANWQKQKEEIMNGGNIQHTRTHEYASRIMEAIWTNTPLKIGGNVLNNGCISNLPREACVEVPCLVDNNGVTPTYVGDLPVQLAAMNSSNIYP